MEIVITESGVTLGTFALSCVVTCLQTFEAEHVEAFGEDGILWTGVTTGTCEASLKKDESYMRRIVNSGTQILIVYKL